MPAISSLRFHLLGRFAAVPASAPDKPLSISSRKGRALLAYLAMQPEPTSTREQLATLLWGDRFDTQARQSLRQCLLSLRRDLEPAVPDLLTLDSELVGLNAQAFSTDAQEFAALAEKGGNPECALAHYRGEFLAGFSLDVEPFDDWVRAERARFEAIAARLLEVQAEQCDERGQGEQALHACARLLAIDKLREDWQRLTLRLTARHRGRDAAMARASTLIALLRSELDADPEPATAALINDIKRGAIASVSQTRSPTLEALSLRDAPRADIAAPIPSGPDRAADAPARFPLEIEPAAATPDWRLKIPAVRPLAALVCIVALAILVSSLWFLARRQSVSPSTARLEEPTIDALIAKGLAAFIRGQTQKNLNEAMVAFKAAHKRDGERLDAMLGIVAVSTSLVMNFHEEAPYLNDAEGLLQRALHKAPDDAANLYHLGRLHLARGQFEAALSAAKRALERAQADPPRQTPEPRNLTPPLPYFHILMGEALVQSGRAAEGIVHIRKAIQQRSSTPFIGGWYRLAGVAELELGQTGAALEWLLRAVAVLPSGDARIHRALAATYALHGDKANAAKHATEFSKIVPAARIASLSKQCPPRLQEGLSLALSLSSAAKRQ